MVARKAFSGIIPTRFLTLLAHLIILAVLLWDQDEHLSLCRSHIRDENVALKLQNEYILCLGLSTSFLIVELLGFLSGISMFTGLHSLFSIACHCSAAFAWSYSYLDRWDCSTAYYWWIFSFCSPLPFLFELAIALQFAACTQ